MNKITTLLLPLFLLLAMVAEPALANKFETISGGVSGMQREKMELLKQISLFSGVFFVLLAVVVLLTRNRFEGFAGYSSSRDTGIAVKGAITLTLVGMIFMGLGLF